MLEEDFLSKHIACLSATTCFAVCLVLIYVIYMQSCQLTCRFLDLSWPNEHLETPPFFSLFLKYIKIINTQFPFGDHEIISDSDSERPCSLNKDRYETDVLTNQNVL